MRKIARLCLLVVLLVSVAGLSAAKPSQTELTLAIAAVTESGQPLQNADVFVYAGAERQLVFRDQTGPDGMVRTRIPALESYRDSDPQFMDITVRSHHPDYPVTVRTWSQLVGTNKSEECVTLRHYGTGTKTNVLATSECTNLDYPPSGNFREVMVGYTTYVDPITIGEMHVLSGLQAKATFSTSAKNEVQSKYKITFPTTGSWTLSGSVTRYISNSVTWNSDGAGSTRRMDTYYNTRKENWEYQEEDGDISGLWHTLEAWDEQFVVSHSGSAVWGSAAGIDTQPDGKPYAQVVDGQWGTFHALGPQNEAQNTSSGTMTYSIAWNRNNIEASAIATYTSGVTWLFKNTRPAGGGHVAAYDNNTGKIWYVTSE